jgi:hypothetical protein
MAAIVLGCHRRSHDQLLSGRWRAPFLQRQPFLTFSPPAFIA